MKAKAIFLPILLGVTFPATSLISAPPQSRGEESQIISASDDDIDEDDLPVTASLIELEELVSQMEQYEVYKEAYHEGHAYFLESDDDLRKRYADLYSKVVTLVIKDALEEEIGRKFKDKLRLIGEGAQNLVNEEIRTTITNKQQSQEPEVGETNNATNERSLSEEDAAKVEKAFRDLDEALDKKSKDTVATDLRTPILNRTQMRIEHLIRFAKDTDAISSGKTTSLGRKLVRIESAEDRAKSDGNLRNAERERLLSETGLLARELTYELSK